MIVHKSQLLDTVASPAPCPNCHQPLQLTPQLLGARVRCLACGSVSAVRAAAGELDADHGRLKVALLEGTEPCPQCHSPLRLTTELAGQRIRCQTCHSVLRVRVAPWRLHCEEASGKDAGTSLASTEPCPHCYRPLQLHAGLAGRRIRCDSCQAVLRVGRPPEPLRLERLPPARTDLPVPAGSADVEFEDDEELAETAAGDATAADVANIARHDPPADEPGWLAEIDWLNKPAVPPEPAPAAPRTVRRPSETPQHRVERPCAAPVRRRDAPPAPDPQTRPADQQVPVQAPASRRAEPPTTAKAPAPAESRPASHRYAQPSLAEGPRINRGWLLAGVLALLAALVGIPWWIARPTGNPLVRYLPSQCDRFCALNWKELAAASFTKGADGAPGLTLVARCRVFLQNAGLADEAVERILAGQAAGGAGTIVVYQLRRTVSPDDIVDRRVFRGQRKSRGASEQIKGVPVYSLGPTLLAFPEPKVVINGDAELVREVLQRWSHRVSPPLEALLQTADLSDTSVVVTAGASEAILEGCLQKCRSQIDTLRGTVASFQYGPTVRCSRILYLQDASAVADFEQAVRAALADAARDGQLPEPVRRSLAAAQVAAEADRVSFDLEIPAAQLQARTLEVLGEFFD